MGTLLVLTGLTASAMGAWRGYVAARSALGPLIHPGDPTRRAVEAARPVVARSRIRLFARRLAVALGWLLVSLYGLLLLSVGLAAS